MDTYTTIAPAYAIGDRVLFKAQEGVVADIYPGSGLPLWWGGRRVVHTHNYAVGLPHGRTVWGVATLEIIEVAQQSVTLPASTYEDAMAAIEELFN